MAITIVGGIDLVGGIATVSTKDGRLGIFFIAGNGQLYCRWQTQPNNGWSGWGSWGSPPKVGFGSPAEVSIATHRNGYLQIFAVGKDGQLYFTQEYTDRWSGWFSLGAPPNGFRSPTTVSIMTNADGHMEIFTVGGDGQLYHTWQHTIGWSGWKSLGKPK